MNNKPFPLPTGYFGIPLGLSALSLTWAHVDELFTYSHLISNILGSIAVLIWVLFIAMYIYKIFAYRSEVLEEYRCPIRFSFISMIPITTMLSGAILFRWIPTLGESLIWIGTIGQLLFSSIRISELWKGGTFQQKSTRPPFYLPAVAANFTSAGSLAMLGYHDLGYLFLGAGFFAWIIFEPVLLQHLRISSIEAPFRPTMGIILAPAFVGVSAYFSLNGGEVDTFAKFLWGYGFLQLFFLWRLLYWISENGINIGFWAFSFGLASLANSAIVYYRAGVLPELAVISFSFANIAIGYLILMTLWKLIKGQFWLKAK
ncbi:dicarboxylate transporter/tellurite-resistance protein TehA [Pelistega sp. NLN82]|uniref:Dicarboxylate transporter/tellurite-resistance protein TehA n=1 Tax=Pelistega ratti TaxID=2652177 RepID=A0A6L9Y8D3_9BURK|nr:dicarboxylate transporter/tellurite-resistance protein TehA [Pelistega ratti]NEN76636.1 dicarboxylate transporter/tellurite-resistance protein TehA [Pelistega ratti]